MSQPTDRFPGHPMLAATAPVFEALSYPLAATGKVDGVRGLCRKNKVYSRRLKTFPNHYLNHMFKMAADAGYDLDGLDGELATDTNGVFLPGAHLLASRTSSAVMTAAYTPMLRWYLFDIQPTPENGIPLTATYRERFAHLRQMQIDGRLPDWCEIVQYAVVRSPQQLVQVEMRYAALGLEGMVLRAPDAPYKFGRATAREGGFSRVVGWTSCEARIVGAIEAFENTNERVLQDTGLYERAQTVDGKRPLGRLGAWKLERLSDGAPFKCGTGFDHEMGKEFWENRDSYIGKIAKIKSKAAGAKDAPRQPVWDGLRHEDDM